MRFILMLFVMLQLSPLAAEVRVAQPGAKPPPAKIEDLAWMVGHWEGEGLGGRSFETISPAVAGQMAGHFQQVKADGTLQFYEIYHFAPAGDSLVMRIKHFNPDLTAWEDKEKTVDFPLVAIEPGAAYFNGLTMRKLGDGGMESFVTIGGEDGAPAQEVRFTYKRASLD